MRLFLLLAEKAGVCRPLVRKAFIQAKKGNFVEKVG
jgi:hypothetical protein